MLLFTEPEGAEAAAWPACCEGPGQRRDLDRIAEGGAGAVGLDVADGVGLDRRPRQGLAIASACPSTLGAVKPTLAEPSLLTAEPRMTAWTVSPSRQRVLQALEHDDARPRRRDRAAGLGVEGRQWPSGETIPPPGRDSRAAGGDLDRDAAGQREVALAVEQALAGDVDGDQRGRAGGLHAEARAPQVELVGDPGGERSPRRCR